MSLFYFSSGPPFNLIYSHFISQNPITINYYTEINNHANGTNVFNDCVISLPFGISFASISYMKLVWHDKGLI